MGNPGLSERTSFELTELHLALLRRLTIVWVPVNFGAPGIDTVGPYGGEDPYQDIADSVGISASGEEGEEDFTSEQLAFLDRLHEETVFALQVVLQTGKMEPGLYQRRGHRKNWELAKRAIREVEIETFTELVAATPFELFIEPVPLKDVPGEEHALWNAAKAWRYCLCLEGRSMIGYWFGGVEASDPSLIDVLSGLFYWYGKELKHENLIDIQYHDNLIRVLGQDLYERFYDMTWDFD